MLWLTGVYTFIVMKSSNSEEDYINLNIKTEITPIFYKKLYSFP